VGVGSSGQYQANLASGSTNEKFVSSGAGIGSGQYQSNLPSGGVASDKQFSAGAGYSGSSQAVDNKNLGAEHRELGFDKQANTIPSKEKDSVHKVDVHGSLYTSGAGSTFKTNEAK